MTRQWKRLALPGVKATTMTTMITKRRAFSNKNSLWVHSFHSYFFFIIDARRSFFRYQKSYKKVIKKFLKILSNYHTSIFTYFHRIHLTINYYVCNNFYSILLYHHQHHHHHSLRMYFIDFLSISFSCIHLLLLLLLLFLRPCRIISIPEIDVLINGTWRGPSKSSSSSTSS